jgi:hypothetical protein
VLLPVEASGLAGVISGIGELIKEARASRGPA